MCPSARSSRAPSVLMLAVLVAASALFLVRAPRRALHGGGGDFAAPYVSSVKFVRGLNPYEHSDFLSLWHASGATASASENASGQRPVYPPSTLLLMLPFSAMSWPHALLSYVVLCVLLYGGLLYRLALLVGEDWRCWPRIAFLAYGLGLAPIHTGIGVGNLSTLAFLLCVFSLLFAHAHKGLGAGILLALAICIKATIGIPVLAYLLICRSWKALIAAAGFAFFIAAASLARMSQLPPAWIDDYRKNVSYLFGPDGVANFATASAFRFDLINLQVPFYELSHSAFLANLWSWALVALLVALWLGLSIRNNALRSGWHTVGVVLLLGLLPIYQRNYNAGFVIIALLWAFQNLRSPLAKWILVVNTVFLVPGQAILRDIDGRLPHMLTHSFLWNFVAMPQATWAILLSAALLLLAMAMPQGQDGDSLTRTTTPVSFVPPTTNHTTAC